MTPKVLILLLLPFLTPCVLAWQGLDAAGNRVEIPAAGGASVVVFVQPGQSLSQREMDEVRRVLADSAVRPVLAAAVVSGPEARRRAGTIDAKQWTGPILIDEDYACSGHFEVYAWPTTVVFDRAGKVAGKIAGAPLNFASRFSAYLDFGGGAITHGRLEEQLAEVTVVEDSTDQKALRRLRLVDQLLAAGRTEDARSQLREASSLSPTAEAVRLRLARGMLMLGEAKPADELLAAVEGKSAPAGELAYLRGWAAVSLGNWSRAESLLLKSRKEAAPSSHLSYLLGLVYQSTGRHREAAKGFREAYEAASRPTPVGP